MDPLGPKFNPLYGSRPFKTGGWSRFKILYFDAELADTLIHFIDEAFDRLNAYVETFFVLV